jgi:hypothetical protein
MEGQGGNALTVTAICQRWTKADINNWRRRRMPKTLEIVVGHQSLVTAGHSQAMTKNKPFEL